MKKLLIALAFLFSSLATPALAAPQDFTIVNNTGHTVMTLNVSPTSEDEWGPDILGERRSRQWRERRGHVRPRHRPLQLRHPRHL